MGRRRGWEEERRGGRRGAGEQKSREGLLEGSVQGKSFIHSCTRPRTSAPPAFAMLTECSGFSSTSFHSACSVRARKAAELLPLSSDLTMNWAVSDWLAGLPEQSDESALAACS